MIFALKGHIEQVINGEKTQTRRRCKYHSLPRYDIGKTYAIQSGRGKKAIPFGRILITDSKLETENIRVVISEEDAKAEGGYTPQIFEDLFSRMHPGWLARWAYTFEFWSTESIDGLEQALKDARKYSSTKFIPVKEE